MVLLSAAVLLWLSLLSYQCPGRFLEHCRGSGAPSQPDRAAGRPPGRPGLQAFGLAAFVFPVLLLLLAWKWMRSEPVETAWRQGLRRRAVRPQHVRRALAGPGLADLRRRDPGGRPGGHAARGVPRRTS